MTARMAATMSETSAADASTPQPLEMPATDFTSHQLREARAQAVSLAAKNERLVTALGTARERIAVTAAADPLRITEDFFDDVCGRAPEPAERGVLRSAYESALASARSER